jgi:hypothetical protein
MILFAFVVNIVAYETVNVIEEATNRTTEHTDFLAPIPINKEESTDNDSFFKKLLNRLFPSLMTNRTNDNYIIKPISTTRTNQLKNYYRLTSFEKKFENFLLYYCVPFVLWMSLMILVAYVCRRRLEYTRRSRRNQRSVNRNYQIVLALSPQNEFNSPPNYSKIYKADEPPSYESLQLINRPNT